MTIFFLVLCLSFAPSFAEKASLLKKDNGCQNSIEAAIATAVSFYAPFPSGNVAAFDSILAVDWVDNPLLPGQVPGRAGIAAVVGFFNTAFSDLRPTIHQTVASRTSGQDIVVAVRGTVFGTYKEGIFLGLPASNQHVAFSFADFHTVRCGVIQETQHLEDLLGLYFQLGGVPSHAK